MLEALPPVPSAYRGLWERTALQRSGPGLLTDDRPARVFWLQTERWHADLRVPLDRPPIDGSAGLAGLGDADLALLAGQDAFCGLTRVEGPYCSWLRLFDLRPVAAPDIGRMEVFEERLVEHGVTEAYREEWTLVAGSRDGFEVAARGRASGPPAEILLTAGRFRMRIEPRPAAPPGIDPFAPVAALDRAALLWRSSMVASLEEKSAAGWQVRLSTHPWLEGRIVPEEEALPCG
ncbi:hypothetical protein [Jiella sonneratiae]|uniref:DUF2169 domain-containing protein n=1 Tax=Jiella sonneratiae TaxID=2816856 RepID=A0ABS3J4W5_9HYPH|nr:hypothetical protein [Jiella sonneratiae]MBO0903983.1 hypothetical protein [Jiella sonneratiae]